jgi:hypothetical protein
MRLSEKKREGGLEKMIKAIAKTENSKMKDRPEKNGTGKSGLCVSLTIEIDCRKCPFAPICSLKK